MVWWKLHDLSPVPPPGPSTRLPKLRRVKGCINGQSRGTPMPRKHQRLGQHQPATRAFTVSNSAIKDAPSHQWKPRSPQCKPQECRNHHVKVTKDIYCIHYFCSSRIKIPTSHRRPPSLLRSEGEDGLGSPEVRNRLPPPHGEDKGSHMGGSQQQFAPPELQQVKTSRIINSTSQEIQTLGIQCLCQYAPCYQINQRGGGRWHAPNLLPGTIRPFIYLTAILLVQPLLSNYTLFLSMRNYWAVCANCFPVMFHFQTPSSVSLFPFNPK